MGFLYPRRWNSAVNKMVVRLSNAQHESQLHESLCNLNQYHLRDAADELDGTDVKIVALRGTANELNTMLDEAEQSRARLENSLATAHTDLRASEKCNKVQGKTIKSLRSAYFILRERREELRHQLDEERNSNRGLHTQLAALQDKHNLTMDCKRTLKRSLRENKREIEVLEERLETVLTTLDVIMPNVGALEKALYDTRANMANLQRLLNDKDNVIVRLEGSLLDLQSSEERLWHYREGVAARMNEQDMRFQTLNAENETLKLQITTYRQVIHDAEVWRQDQLHSKRLEDEMMAEKTTQIAGLHAQRLTERKRFDTQHAHSQTIIQDLEDRMKKSQREAAMREDAKDKEIAQLRDQLERMQLDRDDQAAQAEAWQDFANKQHFDNVG